jgi:hypothetical protein
MREPVTLDPSAASPGRPEMVSGFITKFDFVQPLSKPCSKRLATGAAVNDSFPARKVTLFHVPKSNDSGTLPGRPLRQLGAVSCPADGSEAGDFPEP